MNLGSNISSHKKKQAKNNPSICIYKVEKHLEE